MVQGWKRHRHSCYTVTNQEQTIHDAQIGYYCHGHLLTVEDRCVIKCQLFALRTWASSLFLNFSLHGRFEQAFVNSLLSASGANSSLYYWIGLMSTDDGGTFLWDLKADTPVPLTFTNWNKHQPGSQALCVCSECCCYVQLSML